MVEAYRHRPPIHIQLSSHGSDVLSNDRLKAHFKTVGDYLDTNPTHNVVVATEHASARDIEVPLILWATKKGVPYSYLLQYAKYEKSHGKLPKSTNQIAKRARAYRTRMNNHFANEVNYIDDLIELHTGRVAVLTEGSTVEEVRRLNNPLYDNFNAKVLLMIEKGMISEAVRLYVEVIELLAETTRTRDVRIASLIDQEIQNSKPDIVYGVYGTVHTGITHNLAKLGYTIERNFPDKIGGTIYFNPSNNMQRKHIFVPEFKPTQEEWADSFLSYFFSLGLFKHGVDVQTSHRISNIFNRELSNERRESYLRILATDGFSRYISQAFDDLGIDIEELRAPQLKAI